MRTDLSSLNPPQRAAVVHGDGPLLVLAGAGSGKTRVVTFRVAHLLERGVAPTAILAVTFTNKAAREMKERLTLLVGAPVARQVTVATFHAFGAQLLREEITRLGYRPRFAILDMGDQIALVRRILKELKADPQRFPPDEVVGRISFARNTGLEPAALLRSGDPLRQLAGRVCEGYAQGKRSLNAVDFDDLLLLPLQLLRDHEPVRRSCQERYQHLLVDEYQDTNLQQLELLRLLVGERRNVCAVGDDDQSIYGWRGARAANILEFERHFPGTEGVALEQNYRSTREILDTANSLIAHNEERRAKRLWSESTSHQPVRLWECRDAEEEARRVVQQIRLALSRHQRRPTDFGVLYRTNAQSRPFELELTEARIPFRVVGGTKFFDRKEVRDLVAYLRVLHDPFDELALLRCINTPPRGIGETTLRRLGQFATERQIGLWSACRQLEQVPGLDGRSAAALRQFIDLVERYRERFQDRADGPGLRELVREVRFFDDIHSQASSFAQAARRIDNVDELIEQLTRHAAKEDPGLQSFLDAVTLEAGHVEQDDSRADEVTLMTLHGAKGLEFPVVYLVGLEEGLLPFQRQGVPAELAEERRLCYVGITRAREELTLSYARTRLKGNERLGRKPSRFLGEITGELLQREGDAEAAESEAARRERVADRWAELRRRLQER